MSDDGAARARKVVQQAWEAARPVSPDARLARRMTREAELAQREQARALSRHRFAVVRRDRVLRRARRDIPVWSAVAGAAALAATAAEGGVSSSGLLVVLAGGGLLRVAVAARRLRHPPGVPPEPPALQVIPPLPPDPRSAAFPAVRRLEDVRVALYGLLPLIGPPGRAVAEQAWAAAAEADAALRWQAARLAAVEPHRGADDALLRPLYDGVEAQERLLAAVAELVVASADPLAGDRLQDATDAVHGLAQGLRELR